MGNSKTGGDDDVTAKGKYLLLSVPEFAEDPIHPGKQMTSYLRLGAASTTWREDPGGELAARVHLGGPPGGHVSPTGSEVNTTGDAGDARPVFIDDTRFRGAGTPHALDEGRRLKESSVLHTRGGWRDHSDGNRITTTYGDKIEVIRGNYKMVVLGRQDDPAMSSGWDASGQHIQDFAYTNPAFLRVEWTQQFDGVWHIQHTTDGVVRSENFGGDTYEFRWGNHFESTTGSESPTNENAKPPRGNPHIIEKTWAQKIESYTGSAAWRIPEIREETWAAKISSVTDASETSETTTVSGTISSSTTADTIAGTTTASTIAETTQAGTIASATTAGAIAGVTVAGAIADLTVAANRTDVYVGATKINVEVAPLSLDVFVGLKAEITIGKRRPWQFPENEEVSIKERVAALESSVISLNRTSAALQHKILATRLYLGLA